MTDPSSDPNSADAAPTRAGFAAIIGAPNAGKSTLVNRLTGSKVSIVTQKVQTTRFPVRGIAIQGDAQIVLVDTPGIFTPRRRLDRAMVASAWGGAEDADVVVHLIDAQSHIDSEGREGTAADRRSAEDTETIIANLQATGTKVILVLVGGRPRLLNGLPSSVHAVINAMLPCELGGQALRSNVSN